MHLFPTLSPQKKNRLYHGTVHFLTVCVLLNFVIHVIFGFFSDDLSILHRIPDYLLDISLILLGLVFLVRGNKDPLRVTYKEYEDEDQQSLYFVRWFRLYALLFLSLFAFFIPMGYFRGITIFEAETTPDFLALMLLFLPIYPLLKMRQWGEPLFADIISETYTIRWPRFLKTVMFLAIGTGAATAVTIVGILVRAPWAVVPGVGPMTELFSQALKAYFSSFAFIEFCFLLAVLAESRRQKARAQGILSGMPLLYLGILTALSLLRFAVNANWLITMIAAVGALFCLCLVGEIRSSHRIFYRRCLPILTVLEFVPKLLYQLFSLFFAVTYASMYSMTGPIISFDTFAQVIAYLFFIVMLLQAILWALVFWDLAQTRFPWKSFWFCFLLLQLAGIFAFLLPESAPMDDSPLLTFLLEKPVSQIIFFLTYVLELIYFAVGIKKMNRLAREEDMEE